jgi:hypothetical protein
MEHLFIGDFDQTLRFNALTICPRPVNIADAPSIYNSAGGSVRPQLSMERYHMMRHVPVALFALLAVAPLVAQAPGWKVRVDGSTSASDPDAPGDVKFAKEGAGFHATNPKAAIYWNPANTPTGTYTIKANFTQLKRSSHTNYYGIVFGGSALDGPDQAYAYFTIAQNNTWLIKTRKGNATDTVGAKTPNDGIKPLDDAGKATNSLEVRVGADKIDFVINGTVVHSEPKAGLLAKTDGIAGIRVNHVMEVQIDNFSVSK